MFPSSTNNTPVTDFCRRRFLFHVFCFILFQTNNFQSVGQGLSAPSINVPGPVVGFGNKLVLSSSLDTTGKQRLAVGNPNGYAHGLLHVYEYNETQWNPIKMYLGRPNGKIGDFFDLSADGSRLAMRTNADGGSSTVKVLNVETGTQVGQELSCGTTDQGHQVSLSSNGRTVAMSCEGFGAKRGKVRFFQLSHNNNHWRSAGFLEGVHSGDLFGWDTSLSASGTRVAISAPGYQGGVADTLTDRGFVGVYDYHWTTNEWKLKGSPLLGVHVRDRFGHALALSSDGRYLIASSPGPGLPGALSFIQTFIFMSNTAGWIRNGQVTTRTETLNGEVAIAGDGSRIAFGSSSPVAGSSSQQQEQQQTTTNRLRVLDKDIRYWKQQTPTVLWHSNQDDAPRFGLAMSGDRIAYGTTSPETGEELVRIMDYSLSTTDSSSDNDSAPTPSSTTVDEAVTSSSQFTIDVIDISAVRFNDNQTSQEIQAIYELDAEQQVKFAVMDLDCDTYVDESFISTTTSRTSAGATTGKDRLEAMLDINHNSIANSPMFRQIDPETAGLSLCLRVDVLDDFKNPVLSETNRVFIEISTTEVFRMNSIDVESGASIDFELQVSLDYNVTACQCDEDLNCNESALTPFDEVRICVRSESSAVEVAGIQQLLFSQGSLSQTAISNSETVGQKTRVEQVGDQVVIHAKLASGFFQSSDPDDVVAFGVCIVKFHTPTGSRYLRATVGNTVHRNVKEGEASSQQQQPEDAMDEASGFGIGFRLLSSGPETTTIIASNDDRLALKYSLSAPLSALVCLCLGIACFYYFKKRRH